MSGVKRTIDCHTLKTQDFILQNSNNTFPAADAVLAVSDQRGNVAASRDINVNSLSIHGAQILDSSGDLTVRTIGLNSSGAAIRTSGDIYINNANIYNFGDQNNTGSVQSRRVNLLDLSANRPNTYLFTAGGDIHENLYWYPEDSAQLVNISERFGTLSIAYRDVQLLTGNDDIYLIPTVNMLLSLFNDRRIFLSLEPG